MNIFFAASIRGGRAHQPHYAHIVKVLKEYGSVHSEHTHDEALSQHGETRLSAAEIFERERTALDKSEILVAEVTAPSLGVGYLISYATSRGKKVVALYNGEDALKLSAMIKGDPNVAVYTYGTNEDIEKILKDIFILRS